MKLELIGSEKLATLEQEMALTILLPKLALHTLKLPHLSTHPVMDFFGQRSYRLQVQVFIPRISEITVCMQCLECEHQCISKAKRRGVGFVFFCVVIGREPVLAVMYGLD